MKPPLKISSVGIVQLESAFQIRKVVLIATAAPVEAVIKDANGQEWVHLKAVANDCTHIDFSEDILLLSGLDVPVLTSGAVLLIYLS